MSASTSTRRGTAAQSPTSPKPTSRLLEGGVPQKIEQFERVVVRGGMPQDLAARAEQRRRGAAGGAEPARPRCRAVPGHQPRQRRRLAPHSQPLVDALDRLIGADDLVAVMTPDMSARDITFARKTTTIDGFLTRYWYWGQREQLNSTDPAGTAVSDVLSGPAADDLRGRHDGRRSRRR